MLAFASQILYSFHQGVISTQRSTWLLSSRNSMQYSIRNVKKLLKLSNFSNIAVPSHVSFRLIRILLNQINLFFIAFFHIWTLSENYRILSYLNIIWKLSFETFRFTGLFKLSFYLCSSIQRRIIKFMDL